MEPYVPKPSSKAPQSYLDPFEETQNFQKDLTDSLFSLLFDIESLPYLRDQGFRMERFKAARSSWQEKKKLIDSYFEKINPNFLQEEYPDTMRSNKIVEDRLTFSQKAFDYFDILKNKLNKDQIKIFQEIECYLHASKGITMLLFKKAKSFEMKQHQYFELRNSLQKMKQEQINEFNQFENIIIENVQDEIEKLKEVQVYFQLTIDTVQKFSSKEEKQIPKANEQIIPKKEEEKRKNQVQPSQPIKVSNFQLQQEEEKKDVQDLDIFKQKLLNAKSFKTTTNIHQTESTNLKSYVGLFKNFNIIANENAIFFQAFKDVKVFDYKFKQTNTIKQKLQQIIEISNNIIIGLSYSKLYKLKLSEEKTIQEIELKEWIYYIYCWKTDYAIVCCYNGIVMLFNFDKFEVVSEAKISESLLHCVYRCNEDGQQLMISSRDGLFIVSVNNSQQFEVLNERYFEGKYITQMIQLKKQQYAACFFDDDNILVGIIDRNTRKTSEVLNPKGKSITICIVSVKGLEDYFLIQTKNDLFIFNSIDHQIIHIVKVKCLYYQISMKPYCEYDTKIQCFKIITAQQEYTLKYNLIEITANPT